MGNSPSRSELNGEHMPNLVNSSPGRETFQSHSYPTKFSSVPLPGIHNEYGSTLPSKSPISNRQHSQREGEMDSYRHGAVSTQSSGFRTPDPLYSMDSLNVVGNNASSITSAELPPSSISPANCVTDPWRTSASSFSDESINTQCRNLSRLHKDYHQHEEDEGLSSSTTFEGDSLNPEATLSGMQVNPSQFHTFTRSCNGKRETTPKPEVAEEAIEQTSTIKRAPSKHMGQRETTPPFPIQQSPKSPIDFSITINGRKVSTCEETPLPLILASQKDSENGSGRPSSKIGITSAELDSSSSNSNTNTLKSRGRMKSPPPPPPITKVNSSSALPTSPPHADPPEKKSLSSSLNSLFRRNMFSSSRKSSVEREKVTSNGSVVKPIQPIPLYQQTRGKNESTSSSSSSSNEHEVFHFEPSSENHQPYQHNDKQIKPQQSTKAEEDATRRNAKFEETSTTSPLPFLHPSVSSATPNLNDHKGGGHCQGKEELQASTANDDFDKVGGGEPKVSEKLIGTVLGNGDDNVDNTIRPCELGKENGNLANHSSTSLAPLSNEKGFRIENIFGNTPPNSVEASIIDPTIPMQPSTVASNGIREANGRIEGPHEKQKVEGVEELHRKKTELDCKDEDHDPDGASLSKSDQIKFLFCLSNGEEMGKSSYQTGNGNGVFDELIERGKSKPLKDCVDDVPLKMEKNLSKGDNDISAEAASVTKNDDGGMPSKFGSELVRGESSRESSPGKLTTTTTTTPPSSLVMGLLHNDKTGKRSNSSSRRSSTCSSVEFNSIPGTNGLLNCNRLSLCSLPDDNNEGNDGVSFHGDDNLVLSPGEGAIIQDQPLSLKSNGNLSDESKSEDVPVKLDLTRGPEEDKSWEQMEFETFEIAGSVNDEKENIEVGQEAELKCLGADAAEEEKFPVQLEQANKTGTFTKSNGFGHQRRLSVSKIELECGNRKNSDIIMTTSAPTASSLPQDKCKATRKGSYPELFVNINPSATLTRKHSSGSEIVSATLSSLTSKEIPTSGSSLPKTSSNPFINQGYQKGPQEEGKSETNPSRNKASFTNDFLQTLGQIYASKSKLISGKTQGSSAPLTPASSPTTKISSPMIPPEKDIPVGVKSSKSTDSSMDTMDFECQDRSISEYNISPRSARQLVTDSMINGGDSRASSSLSQKGIGSLPEVDVKQIPIAPIPIPPVPFSSGVEMLPNDTVTNGNGSVKIPSPPQSKALTNNSNFGTYKKKPTFIKGKVPNVEGFLPCVDIYDQPSSTSSQSLSSNSSSSPCPSVPEKDVAVKISVKSAVGLPLPQPPILNEELPKFPTPPPMPLLHYCQSSSASSSALSSMGDSSEISQNSDKSKSSTSSSSLWPSSKLNSKSSGNGSSECSLVELTAVNPKSTSDAIIVELKKAQAKKLRSAELQSIVTVIPDVQNNAKTICRDEQNISVIPTLPIQEKLKRRLDESRINQSKLAGSDVSVFSDRSCSSTTKLVDDPLVQTIVNGKHTNSIIVSDSPLEIGNSDTVKRNGVNNNKNLVAHLRGNIMSPSLSGNYTEMNGIDSETMGASGIHEDELSGQLQKENHNDVDEIQTSNKLDGVSFRRVLNEYEKTLSMFIQQIDQLKSRMDETETEKQTLIKERDQALEDLRNVESAFSDVHRKYERAKALLENMKSNEDSLVRRDQEMMQRIDNRDKKIDMIKDKAQESIEKMHLDYETRIKEMEFDNAKLRAQYRKMEMKLSTLENDVEQKAKMNAQLNALCDELINGEVGKVGKAGEV